MAGTEQVFARSPGAQPGSRIIAAPFEFYTTGEDNLRITSFCSIAGVVFSLDLRTIDNTGSINAHRHAHTPNADRSAKSDDIPLGVGAVMNITVFATAGAPKIGQAFVIVQLIRGLGTAAVVLGTLLQGYVTQRQALGWPGSPIQSSLDGQPPVSSFVTAVPALGTDWHFEVPTGARWEIHSLQATLATVGAAARVAFVQISRSFGFSAFFSPQATQAGAVSVIYVWAPNLPFNIVTGTGVIQQPIGAPCILSAADQIGALTQGLTAFDQWSGVAVNYREWLEAQT